MPFNQIKVELCSVWGGDRNVAEQGWASSMDKVKLQDKSDDDVRRFVTGAVTLHHDTPKERFWMEFFITCPIFVERQFDKYRITTQFQDAEVTFFLAPFGRDGITQNELSGRYRTIPDRPYGLPNDVARLMAKAFVTEAEPFTGYEIQKDWDAILEEQHLVYQRSLTALRAAEKAGNITNAEYKRIREVIRGVLGTSYLTDMRIIMNGNALEHIINQRLAVDAQVESRVVAAKMLRELQRAQACPGMIEDMIKENGWDKALAQLYTIEGAADAIS